MGGECTPGKAESAAEGGDDVEMVKEPVTDGGDNVVRGEEGL